MIYMWFTCINYYKLAVEKDRDSIFMTKWNLSMVSKRSEMKTERDKTERDKTERDKTEHLVASWEHKPLVNQTSQLSRE